jgi:hypothetical protein
MGKQSRRKRERRAAAPPPAAKEKGRARSSSSVRLFALGALLATVVLVAGLAVVFARSAHPRVALRPAIPNEAALPGLERGAPPWPAEHRQLGARLDALGLPRLQMEADAYHIHQHLDLYVNGRHLTVPALIGINLRQRYLDPLHTHDPSGIIHIESPTRTDYTLGQFFAAWGLPLSRTCIGGLRIGGNKTLCAWVNGTRVRGDPRESCSRRIRKSCSPTEPRSRCRTTSHRAIPSQPVCSARLGSPVLPAWCGPRRSALVQRPRSGRPEDGDLIGS